MDQLADVSTYLKYAITTLGALLAVLGLYVDKNGPYFRLIAPLFIIIVITLAVFQGADAVNTDRSAHIASEQRIKLLSLLDSTSITSTQTSSYLTDILLSQPKILRDFGLSEQRAGKPLENLSTFDLVNAEILQANRYRMELIAEKPPSMRLDTTIWYYNKEMDTPELTSALREVGFEVENRIAQRNQANDPTNAVWYGPNVQLDDYKAVVVSLIRAGIDIRRTGPACRGLINKTNVIEVGASDEAAGQIDGLVRPTKSIEMIRNAKTLRELDDIKC